MAVRQTFPQSARACPMCTDVSNIQIASDWKKKSLPPQAEFIHF